MVNIPVFIGEATFVSRFFCYNYCYKWLKKIPKYGKKHEIYATNSFYAFRNAIFWRN